ncbi:MAG: pyrroline-5-carboxylate reductase [Planctomycetota bacterium]
MTTNANRRSRNQTGPICLVKDSSVELAFIGAGHMAEAMARGILRGRRIAPSRMAAADPAPSRRRRFRALGLRVTSSSAGAAAAARVVILAVKPQQADAALAQLRGAVGPGQLVISIVAGLPTRAIERVLGTRTAVVRAMPNLPMVVGEGATAIAAGRAARAADIRRVRALFETSSRTLVLPERHLDAVTALSGSGPAYVAFFLEHLARGAVAAGLRPCDARFLALQTFRGTAALLSATGDTPEELRCRVTTPGGTTQAGIAILTRRGADGIIADAVRAAARRARELGASRKYNGDAR